ncbi:MAG: glycosyltransferase family 2 protein [Planctomycetes bacterium]|nr:glycosyltransferase family 2 protein [Planctomycetota bacterium]
MRVSAVVPVLDEEPTLDELHRRLSAVLAAVPGGHEIVFVNDGSRDGSLARMKEIAARDPRVVVVDLRRHAGKTRALAAGFAEARGEVLVTLDSDLQDVPEEVPKLLARIDAGADFVTGRKQSRQDPWTRRLASRIFNGVVSLLAGMRVRDVNSGLKALRREVAEELPLHGELHRFLPVFAGARGFRVEEVDVAHEPRRHGRSRYGWSRYAAGFFDSATVLLLTRYGTRPLHFFGCFGLLVALVGGAVLGYLALGWLFGEWIGGRPLLLFGVLAVLLGIQCVFFGLLAELVVVASRREERNGIRQVIRRE